MRAAILPIRIAISSTVALGALATAAPAAGDAVFHGSITPTDPQQNRVLVPDGGPSACGVN